MARSDTEFVPPNSLAIKSTQRPLLIVWSLNQSCYCHVSILKGLWWLAPASRLPEQPYSAARPVAFQTASERPLHAFSRRAVRGGVRAGSQSRPARPAKQDANWSKPPLIPSSIQTWATAVEAAHRCPATAPAIPAPVPNPPVMPYPQRYGRPYPEIAAPCRSPEEQH